MWSGPRNISTALLRAWENRPDTAVRDEPFYAFYLQQTGKDHPGAEEVIASQQTDWRQVALELTHCNPSGASILYQKHMAHHLLPGVDLQWLTEMTNCLLIREPREVLASLIRVLPAVQIEDTGLPQQLRIYDFVASGGAPPLVVDAADLLAAPREMLTGICERVGVEFLPEMLAWPAGPRESDGVWGKYWYEKVYRSTGFAAHRNRVVSLPEHLDGLLHQCRPMYQRLYESRFVASA